MAHSAAGGQNTPAMATYRRACHRDGIECVVDVLNALNSNGRELSLSHRKTPLKDRDICCLAEALTCQHVVRVLDLEENAFGADGVRAVMDALAVNPGIVRELRLGKNSLRDPCAVIIANQLSAEGAGLKVVDLSENQLTKAAAQAMSQAIESRGCDLVELSFHCNELDHEAALALAQAVRVSTRLKHLHLGYNALRDRGAAHLARALPIARSLLTLDLTANRIGPEGGMELINALLHDTTTLQRLNLRHNNFDDETLLAFAAVIEKNRKLTQLFLGYMNPSFDTAKKLLAAVGKENRTLMCFDIFGWRFETQSANDVITQLLESNTTLRALISDFPFDEAVSSANRRRGEAGLHSVYVGGDDRLAAAACSQLPGKAGGASRSISSQLPPPRPPSPGRKNGGGGRGGWGKGDSNEISPRRNSTSPKPQQSPSAQRDPHPRNERSSGGSNNTGASKGVIVHKAHQEQANRAVDEDLELLMEELQYISCDPELRSHLSMIISQVQLKVEVQRSYHQQQLNDLNHRLRLLEVEYHKHFREYHSDAAVADAHHAPSLALAVDGLRRERIAEESDRHHHAEFHPDPPTARTMVAAEPSLAEPRGRQQESATAAANQPSTPPHAQPASRNSPARRASQSEAPQPSQTVPAAQPQQPKRSSPQRRQSVTTTASEPTSPAPPPRAPPVAQRQDPVAVQDPPPPPLQRTNTVAPEAVRPRPAPLSTSTDSSANCAAPPLRSRSRTSTPPAVAHSEYPSSPGAAPQTPHVQEVRERSDRIMTVQRVGPEALEDTESPRRTGRTSSPDPRSQHRGTSPTPRTSSVNHHETPLCVPAAKGEEPQRTSHSPAPLLADRCPTPDLQHSRHTDPTSHIEAPPPAQPKIVRPHGCRASGVQG